MTLLILPVYDGPKCVKDAVFGVPVGENYNCCEKMDAKLSPILTRAAQDCWRSTVAEVGIVLRSVSRSGARDIGEYRVRAGRGRASLRAI